MRGTIDRIEKSGYGEVVVSVRIPWHPTMQKKLGTTNNDVQLAALTLHLGDVELTQEVTTHGTNT